MFVNISTVIITYYPISELEVPFNWEWLVGSSLKRIVPFAYFWQKHKKLDHVSLLTSTIHQSMVIPGCFFLLQRRDIKGQYGRRRELKSGVGEGCELTRIMQISEKN